MIKKKGLMNGPSDFERGQGACTRHQALHASPFYHLFIW